jgi:hypothetical protein
MILKRTAPKKIGHTIAHHMCAFLSAVIHSGGVSEPEEDDEELVVLA